MSKKSAILIVSVIMFFVTSACSCTSTIAGIFTTAGYKNGQIVTAKVDADCWQCPDGEDATSTNFDRVENCVSQYSHGKAPEGTQMTVVANEYGDYAVFGSLRVSVTGLVNTNPLTGEEFSSDYPAVCWIDATDIK